MEKALKFQIIFKFPFWVQTGVANANVYMYTSKMLCIVLFVIPLPNCPHMI